MCQSADSVTLVLEILLSALRVTLLAFPAEYNVDGRLAFDALSSALKGFIVVKEIVGLVESMVVFIAVALCTRMMMRSNEIPII